MPVFSNRQLFSTFQKPQFSKMPNRGNPSRDKHTSKWVVLQKTSSAHSKTKKRSSSIPRYFHKIREFGVLEVRDLIPNGRNVQVTEDNKMDYVRLVCQMKMTGAIRKQLSAFLEGFYNIIPRRLISIFNEQELESCLENEASLMVLMAFLDV